MTVHELQQEILRLKREKNICIPVSYTHLTLPTTS